jgi:hypothetical protein
MRKNKTYKTSHWPKVTGTHGGLHNGLRPRAPTSTLGNHCECLGPRISLSLDWPWLRKQKKMKSGQGFLVSIKVIRKVRQRRHQNPLFRHVRDEISKNGEKKLHWASTGHQTQFNSKFGAKLSLPCPFFS